jgi:hypothetical protein
MTTTSPGGPRTNEEMASVGDAPGDDPLSLAHGYLRAVRSGDSPAPFETALRDLGRGELREALSAREARLAFWVNVYNAAAQSVLDANPAAFESRRTFFGADLVAVAGERLSLDDVEHGLLRRSRPKWSLGYVTNPFPGAFERAFRAGAVDPRVHFALNCGAAACPPIAAYDADRMDEQLDLATASYLEAEVEYDPEGDVVRVPRLMLWFRGDFGGREGIKAMLCEYGVVPGSADPTIRYRQYDWTLSLGRFAPVESGEG